MLFQDLCYLTDLAGISPDVCKQLEFRMVKRSHFANYFGVLLHLNWCAVVSPQGI